MPRLLSLCSRAREPQFLKPTHPGACALQLESTPALHNERKALAATITQHSQKLGNKIIFKNSYKKNVYIRITESLCCTVEISIAEPTLLQQNKFLKIFPFNQVFFLPLMGFPGATLGSHQATKFMKFSYFFPNMHYNKSPGNHP